jgi:uncharacterized protein (DUF2141 family)
MTVGLRWRGTVGVSCAWMLVLVSTSMAQSVNGAAGGTGNLTRSFTIAGTAVNARTGEVLAQARISVEEVAAPRKAISMTTGANGHFAFAGLKLGKYRLSGAKRGFLPGAYEQHERFSTAIVTGADFATEKLELQLTPMALITGHVYDEFGEGVRGAQVVLYYENRSAGMRRIVRTSVSRTDDRGYYDFNLLRPGNYYVAVTAKPWYAMHAASDVDGTTDGTTDAGHIPPSLDVAYPTTYFGGVSEAEQATPIEVHGGDQQQIDVHVSPAQSLHLRFRVPVNPTDGSYSFNGPQLQKRVFDSVQWQPVEGSRMVAPGVFEVSGVPPGRYTVRASNAISGQMEQSTELDLERDGQEVSETHNEPLASLKVSVTVPGGEPLPKAYFVALLGPHERAIGMRRGDASAPVTFENLAPGTYAIRVSAEGKAYSVTRTASEAGDAAGHDVTVGAGVAMEVTASVATGNVTIEGVVQKNGKPLAGVMVALVPKDPDSHIEMFRRDQSDLDGTFHAVDVIPGSYTVVAVEDAWGFEWLKPEVLARYVQHGQMLTVGELMKGSVHLPDPVEVQPR